MELPILKTIGYRDMVEKQSIYTADLLKNTSYAIGLYTYGNPTIHDWGDGGTLIVGKYTSIADNVNILLGGNHRLDWVTTYPFHSLAIGLGNIWLEARGLKSDRWSKGDVVIGNDVWIGLGVTILSGVTIGDGAVLAAGSIVTKSVEPYSVVAGNPAKLIKMRFTQYEIEELLRLAWWNWDIEKVKLHLEDLSSNNLYLFIPKLSTNDRLRRKLKPFVPNVILKLRRKIIDYLKKTTQ